MDARITLLTTAAGGRKGPILSGYRPNHRFNPNTSVFSFFIGEVQFSHKNEIFPGDTEVVTILFLRAGGTEKYLLPGEQWLIHEGARLVGQGEILKILSGS